MECPAAECLPAVSYTHLDVYKRQLLCRLPACGGRDRNGIPERAASAVSSGMGSAVLWNLPAVGLFQLQQGLFHAQPAAVAHKGTARPNDAVAGDGDEDGIGVIRHAHRPEGLREMCIRDRIKTAPAGGGAKDDAQPVPQEGACFPPRRW